ncbi:hypothetical protein FKM82_026616 [Ascaphus truei]
MAPEAPQCLGFKYCSKGLVTLPDDLRAEKAQTRAVSKCPIYHLPTKVLLSEIQMGRLAGIPFVCVGATEMRPQSSTAPVPANRGACTKMCSPIKDWLEIIENQSQVLKVKDRGTKGL